MNHLAKAGIATLSAGAIGSAGYGGYVYFSKDSFASKLGISLLNLTGDSNEATWGERFKEFNSTTTGLDPSLNKTSIKKWKDLQKWCNDNKNNSFNKGDQKFQNFESFCTWKIGDKITSNIPKDAGPEVDVWKTAHTQLKTRSQGKTLSEKLQTVLTTEAGTDKADQKAMHKWCTDAYKNTWRGNNDETFKEASEYCKS
ncbi:hypothetical protein A6V39_00715 [Candidatus Mycoplasma haematobovis]|uniref:Uncharacterized protein n=1 Tax=Candidatus Mycoplasma haematobovis TaxID=432608 RepID=A0A1A9QDN1_9MOLU|nr:hypothetical protein [Candidatus Mycoplasma haematobovis]OAL10573.1 hypothetical protein A6V39_00715 [Candidatus Mycoplasma haematobovis]